MPEYGFLVSYNGKAWVTVDADSVDEAREHLCNESCALGDYARVENSLEFNITIEKEQQ